MQWLPFDIKYSTLSKATQKQVDCLAENILFEAGHEPQEGKVAVAMVTLNRLSSGNYSDSVCGVVKQKTHYNGVTVCQFSWVCAGYARQPKSTDERWIESRQIAEGIARGDYEEYRAKYGTAMYFHATGIRPIWAKTKKLVTKTGHHLFYE